MRSNFLWMAAAVLPAILGLAAQQPAPPAPQNPPVAKPAAPPAPRQPAPFPQHILRTVVLDPAHGGADEGAHGANGVAEKDVVLVLAQAVRGALERQGLRVVLTRQGNEDPSFDDRAALANAQPGAIFISLHISSTGPVGTARAYYFDSGAPGEPSRAARPVAAGGLLPWTEAQLPAAGLSRRLAELLQVDLAQMFRGSPEVPSAVVVHQLRLIAEPAVAVEISSVSVADADKLYALAPRLGETVARAMAGFRLVYEAGAR